MVVGVTGTAAKWFYHPIRGLTSPHEPISYPPHASENRPLEDILQPIDLIPLLTNLPEAKLIKQTPRRIIAHPNRSPDNLDTRITLRNIDHYPNSSTSMTPPTMKRVNSVPNLHYAILIRLSMEPRSSDDD